MHLGCLVTLAPLMMPRLGKGFRELHSAIALEMVEAGQQELVTQLRSGRLSVTLTYDLDLAARRRVEPGPRRARPRPAYDLRGARRARGIEIPEPSISLTPNVTRPRSRGRVWLSTPDPDAPPQIDYRYFTDPRAMTSASCWPG